MSKIKGYNKHRLIEDDPYYEKEVNLNKAFNKKNNECHGWNSVIFGWKDKSQSYPADTLTEREQKIVASAIQWLGTPCGQYFLRDTGIIEEK